MTSVSKLARMLNDVYLNNIIDECVITVEDDVAKVLAIDKTNSLFVSAHASFEHKDTQLGIGNLPLFCHYMNILKDTPVKFKQDDNILRIKPKNDVAVKYVMTEVELVPSYKEEWEDEGDLCEIELEEYEGSLDLTMTVVEQFLTVLNLFKPSSVSFYVDKKGKVTLHGGRNTEHELDHFLGESNMDECKAFVYSEHLSAVLSALDYEQEPKLHLKDEEAVIISSNTSSWLLRPVADD